MGHFLRSLLLLSLTGCGSGAHNAAPARPPLATIEVPKDTDPEPANEAAPPERGSNGAGNDFGACIARMRDAKEVNAPEGERRLYDDARAAESRNDFMTARKTYFQLLQQFPSSRLVPLAYLAFGELFANEAQSDPTKWDLAHQAYLEVAKYPPPDDVAYPFALLRLGDTRKASDAADALAQYMRSLEASRQFPVLPCADAIRAEARLRAAEVFVSVGAPEKSYALFKSREDENEALEMMERLVENYRRASKPGDACAAIRSIPQQLDRPAAVRLRAQSKSLCAKP